ncbi:MAG: DRTGG domain-containing protein [Clostridia bacterium]
MKISEIATVVGGEIVCSASKADFEVYSACSSDMMSDVLAYVHDQGLLITGLANPQVVRTAEMMDMNCIILVRGKKPDETMLALAEKKEIVFICTEKSMFETAGKLYQAGLKS